MRVTGVTVRDRYVQDGESVVLTGDGRAIALSPVATALLAHLEEAPREVTDLTAALVDRFGVPADRTTPHEAVHQLVRELADAGLVVPVPDGDLR